MNVITIISYFFPPLCGERKRPTYRLWADIRWLTKSRRNLVALQGAVKWKKQNASLSNSPIDSFWSNEYVYSLRRLSLARARTFLVGWCLFFVDNITDLHTTAYHLFGGDHRADTRSVSLSRTKTKRKNRWKINKILLLFLLLDTCQRPLLLLLAFSFRSRFHVYFIFIHDSLCRTVNADADAVSCFRFFFIRISWFPPFRTKWTVRWRLWIAVDEEFCIVSYSTSSSSSNSQWHMQCRIVRRNSIRFHSN